MIFAQFRMEALEANTYIVGCTQTGEALLVDAGDGDPRRFRRFCDRHGFTLTTVFITHHHYDHVDGLAAILREFSPAAVFSARGHVGGCDTRRIAHGDTLRFGAFEGRAVATPGHTDDGLSLIFPGFAFTGDALYAGSVGGTESEALAELQRDHIRRHLLTLPDTTQLHPGHGPATTVGIEKRFNAFFV
jgi:hydroxyacylglutathione hydrolase